MWIGRNKNKKGNICNISFVQEPVKFLGIYIGYDKLTCIKKNWKEKVSKLAHVLKTWEKRNLSFFGKITIIKTLALSKLIYNLSITDIPKQFIPEINKILFNFLWSGKREKIKRNIIIQDIMKGGLKMIDLNSIIDSLKLSWVKRLVLILVNRNIFHVFTCFL